MQIDRDTQLEGFRRMVRIRLFEETVTSLQKMGELYGGLHTSIGQEASAVGALLAVNPGDYMTGTHRSHGHPIGKGSPVGPLMAEIMGRSNGVCGGKGGSMHLADFAVGSLGESGIVASAMPVAVGAGLSSKLLRTGQVCVCFFGDGASNEGAFHEALNLAAVWRLPVIFLCENNGYAITTAAADSMAIRNVADRAPGYGMPGVVVDGQDFHAVFHAIRAAADRARAGEGPSLVEAKTYRFVEHSAGMQGGYRSDEEIAAWRARDPIEILQSRLLEAGVAAELLAEVRADEAAAMTRAVEEARASPEPDPADAFQGLYANPFPIAHAAGDYR